MRMLSKLIAAGAALMMTAGGAMAAGKVTLAIGGASCLCYLPTVLAKQLGEYEKLLPENEFMRVHDKYIINLSFIREYIKGNGGEVILENGKEIPVASRRKEDFLSLFERWIRRKA